VFIYLTIDKEVGKMVVRNSHLEHNHPGRVAMPNKFVSRAKCPKIKREEESVEDTVDDSDDR